MSQPTNRIRDHLQIVLTSDDALEIDNAPLEALLENTDGEPFAEDEVRRILIKVSEVGLIHSRSNNDAIVKTMESVTQKADPMISNPNRTQTDSQRSLVPPSQPLAPRRSVGSTATLVVVSLSLVVVLAILTTNGPRSVDESQSVYTFQVPQPGSPNESKIAALNGRRQSIGFAGLIPRPKPESPAVRRVAVGDHVRTTDRERRRLSLPDGSVLYVNENTSLRIQNERQIVLSAGEVFVEVVPTSLRDDHAPFVVQTPKRTVTALGTKFAVEAAPKHTEVLVTQGKVQISGLIKPLIGGQEIRIEDRLPAAAPSPSRRASQVLSWTKDLMAAADSPLVPGSDYDGGALVVVDPAGQEQKLEMRRFHVDVHIEDGFARTTIDQTYFNTQWSRLEGTFYFPLPPDASLSRLAMYVGANLMEGGMAERDHARNVFEQIMYTKRDPALLEWVDGSTFKMRVFPLEPRQEKRILLSYTQRLRGAYGEMKYRFPAGHNHESVGKWSTRIQVHGGAKLKWSSTSHQLKKTGPSEDEDDLILETELENAELDQDLVLNLQDQELHKDHRRGGKVNEIARISTADHEGFRYLMLRFRPSLPGKLQREQRHWVFLYETSGNRNPLLARVQIDVIESLLENAEHADTFSIVVAANEAKLYSEQPKHCTQKEIGKAVSFLERVHLVGALDLEKALKACQAPCEQGENPYLIHVGSAIPVLGDKSQNSLLKIIPKQVRFVGVGVGKRWSRQFMKSAAAKTGGYFTQINPDEKVSWRAFELLSTLNAPRMFDVHVLDGAERLTFLNETDTLVQGEELCAMTRFPADAAMPKKLHVTGRLNGKIFERILAVKDLKPRAEYLPRSWAKLEIDRLIAEGAQKNKNDIIMLSKAMYVMSPFTSLLVLENEAMYAEFKVDRGRKDHWALYPAPKTIQVVKESGPPPVSIAVKQKTKSATEQLLSTVVVRKQPQILRNVGYYTNTQGYRTNLATLIEDARRLTANHNDTAMSILRRTLRAVQSASDINTRTRQHLERQLRTELMSVRNRRELDLEVQIRAQERLAVFESEKNLLNQTQLNDVKLRSLMTQVRAAIDRGTSGDNNSDAATQLSSAFQWSNLRADRFLTALDSVEITHVPMPFGETDGEIAMRYQYWQARSTDVSIEGTWPQTVVVITDGNSTDSGISEYILTRPDLAPSVYDLAIQSSGVAFSRDGSRFARGIFSNNASGTGFFEVPFGNMISSQPSPSVAAWGMPMTATPIGLPGPPHLPYGRNAGLRSFTIRNLSITAIPTPTDNLFLGVPIQAQASTWIDGRVRLWGLNENPIAAYRSTERAELRDLFDSVGHIDQLIRERRHAEELMTVQTRVNELRNDNNTVRLSLEDEILMRQRRNTEWKSQIARYIALNMLGDNVITMPVPQRVGSNWSRWAGPSDIWRRLTERSKKWSSVDLHNSSSAVARIYEALNEQTEIEFRDIPLIDAIEFLSDLHNIPIILNETALADQGISIDAAVNMVVSGITLRSALNLILQPLGLHYVIEDEVMQVTTAKAFVEQLKTIRFLTASAIDRRVINNVVALVRGGRTRNFLTYQTPVFSGNPRIVRDVLAHAPGMNTVHADVHAIMAAEKKETSKTTTGKIDPDARALIDRARSAGWQAVKWARNDGTSLTLRYDGQGRFTYERSVSEGLRERVVCDGENLWHIYAELGVAARRQVNRSHRRQLLQLVPWTVPPAEDLAINANIKLIDKNTIAIVPLVSNEKPKQDDQDAPSTSLEWHLAFNQAGRLTERRIIQSQAKTHQLVIRETYDSDGTAKMLDHENHVISEQKFNVRSVSDQNVKPDLQSLVVLPLPLRSQEHVSKSTKRKLDGKYADWDEHEALALIAAAHGKHHVVLMSKIIQQRFFSKGDHRLGFYSLLLSGSTRGGLAVAAQNLEFAPVTHHPNSPLARFLNQMWTRSGSVAIGGNELGFIQRLAEAHRLVTIHPTGKNKEKLGLKDQRQAVVRTLNYVKHCRSQRLAWTVLSRLFESVSDPSLAVRIAEQMREFENAGPLAYAARYEAARLFLKSGNRTEARRRFVELFEQTFKAGVLPPIDSSIRDAFGDEKNNSRKWSYLMEKAHKTLLDQERVSECIVLSFQCRQLGDHQLADRLFFKTAIKFDAAKYPHEVLFGIDYLAGTKLHRQTEKLVESLLKQKRFAMHSTMWRLAEWSADRSQRPKLALARLETAMDLEYQSPPESITLQDIRRDYQTLFARFETVVASVSNDDKLIPRIVRAADRWRSLDGDATNACQLAGRLLNKLGSDELAWSYLTTPVAMRPDQASAWTSLAKQLASQGSVEMASRAYETAFEQEATNPQILWDHSKYLKKQGRDLKASELLNQLANGKWQPRFRNLQKRARREVDLK